MNTAAVINMSKKVLKVVVPIAVTAVSNYIADKQLDEKITAKVAEALAKTSNEEA